MIISNLINSHEINLLYQLYKKNWFGTDRCEAELVKISGLNPNKLWDLVNQMDKGKLNYIEFEKVVGCGGRRFTLLPKGERLLMVFLGIWQFLESNRGICEAVCQSGAYSIDIILNLKSFNTPKTKSLLLRFYSEGGQIVDVENDSEVVAQITDYNPQAIKDILNGLYVKLTSASSEPNPPSPA